MSKLDEIKEKVSEADRLRAEVGELSEVDELYLTDIKLLLSRLEKTEKMFEKILDERFRTAPPEQMNPIYREIAIQALQQLRR